MSKDNSPRICRVIPSYPSTQMPGGGLPAYYLSSYIEHPTLHIVRKQASAYELVPLPEHVRLIQVDYPDFAIGNRGGLTRKLLGIAKICMSFVFFAKSIPSMLAFRPTVIHVHTAIPLFHGLFGKYFMKARWVITLHGSDFLEVRRSKLIQSVLRRVDVLCYVSERMGKELRQLFPGTSMQHTPSGVDLEIFQDTAQRRLPQVVMVGRLTWQKDYSYALQSFALFRQKHSQWKLVILGAGEEQRNIQEQIAQLGLDGHVSLLGLCSQEVVAETLQKSSIFLLTSIAEGFPKVLLEAAACGTPMVATDVGDCRDVSDCAGITVTTRSTAAMSSALTRLADDDVLWQRCSDEGKRLVEKYKWCNIAEDVSRIYI